MDWKTAFCKLTDSAYDLKCLMLEYRIHGVSEKEQKTAWKEVIIDASLSRKERKRRIKKGYELLADIYSIQL